MSRPPPSEEPQPRVELPEEYEVFITVYVSEDGRHSAVTLELAPLLSSNSPTLSCSIFSSSSASSLCLSTPSEGEQQQQEGGQEGESSTSVTSLHPSAEAGGGGGGSGARRGILRRF